MPSPLSERAVTALESALQAKPGAVARPGQRQMVEAVAAALEDRAHLLVEAGTGTGKSLAYLIPALMSGRRIVVSTATKSLQNQLADTELPFLATVLGVPVTWSVVKGRQSYACRAKLAESCGAALDGVSGLEMFPEPDAAVAGIASWVASGGSGDRDDLPDAVSDETWRAVSVSGMECPGKAHCPEGNRCCAEAALDAAAVARVTVTNHHLYALHLASGGRILPDHDAVVFDEAHKLESAANAAFGVDVSGRRVTAYANNAARLLVREKRDEVLAGLRAAAERLDMASAGAFPARLDPGSAPVGEAVLGCIDRVGAAGRALRQDESDERVAGAIARVKAQGGHVQADFGMALDLPSGYVAWAEPERRLIRIAPIEVDDSIARSLLVHRPAILTSATMTIGGSFISLAQRLGFAAASPDDDSLAEEVVDPLPRTYRELNVQGTFDYAAQGLLYVAAGLPEPPHADWPAAVGAEIAALTGAAGGRALILTTSFRMLEMAAAALDDAGFAVLVQGSLPKRQLIARFASDETATLVATMGYWEGIDVPGPSLSLVIIDRIPFPRPDDPLMEARRDAVATRGGRPFDAVDLPHATLLLAQGAGRLIRNEHDRGVVAVLDRRLVSQRYGQRILHSLPRLLRTSDRERAIRYLRELAGANG